MERSIHWMAYTVKVAIQMISICSRKTQPSLALLILSSSNIQWKIVVIWAILKIVNFRIFPFKSKNRSLSKRKKFKKRKVSKVHTSRGTKPSGSDSFKLSLFKPNQIGVMLNSLSNLESNASNYSSTTISPPPRRMKNLR